MNNGQARLGYADVSPACRRRFCSSTCLNRHKVAAYRQRVSKGRPHLP
ncbi:MAG: CGNR zinc finger domain-containing protein [Thermocrispum sp.]